MRSAMVWALPAAIAFLSLPCAGQTKGIPRMPDGKPNFNGVWAGPAFAHNVGPNDTDTPLVTNFDPKRMSPLLPGAEAIFRQPPTGDVRHDDPTELCLPDGHPREALAPYAQQIVQTPDTVVFLYEYMHFFRVIPINKPHPQDPDSTFMGDSVAKWDGDTLVVDTIGFNGKDFFSQNVGQKISDEFHLIERFQRTRHDVLELDMTYCDPKAWGDKCWPGFKKYFLLEPKGNPL